MSNMYPPHYLGGYEVSCRDVVERLRARGHEVCVLTGDMRVDGVEDPPGEADAGVWRDLELYLHRGELLKPSLRGRLAMERHNQRALARALERARPDVVSVWHMGALSTGLLTTLVRSGVPIVYSICDDWLSYADRIDAWTWRLRPWRAAGRAMARAVGAPVGPTDLSTTGAFLFISRVTRDRAVRYTGRSFPIADIVLNGIDDALFNAPENDEQRPWAWRLVYVGRYDVRKGIDTVLDALPMLPAEATLRVIGTGTGPELDRIVARVAELGLGDRVTLEPRARHELPSIYREVDVTVFPSAWEEPFGLVPLESMACRTPVISTAVGGSAEFSRDGANCLVFPANDAAALAKCVEALAVDPSLRARLVEGGVATAGQLSVDKLADTFEVWHDAAADGFATSRPAPRRLELPSSRRAGGVVRKPGLASLRSLGLLTGASGRPRLEIDGQVVAVTVGGIRAEVVCDLPALPFRDGAFSGARCVDGLERLAEPWRGVDELARSIQPGGACSFVGPNRHDLRRTLTRLRRGRPPDTWWPCHDYPTNEHLLLFGWTELEALIDARFAVTGRDVGGWGETPRARLAGALVRLPGLRRLSAAIVLRAIRR